MGVIQQLHKYIDGVKTDVFPVSLFKSTYTDDGTKSLNGVIGSTDISSIGDGTINGAISTLNTNKADSSSLGTAAAKAYTTSVTSGSTDLITSGAVYSGLSSKANSSSLGTQCTYSLSGTTLTITSK